MSMLLPATVVLGNSGIDASGLVALSSIGNQDLGAQINAADNMLGNTPGIIVVPNGNFNITTQIVLRYPNRVLQFGVGIYTLNASSVNGSNALIIFNNYVTVKGAGIYQTTLISAPLMNGDDIIRAIGPGSVSYTNYTAGGFTVVIGAIVSDLTIDGNRANVIPHPNDTYGNGVNFNCAGQCLIERVRVQNIEAQGIVFGNGNPQAIGNNIARFNIVTACGEIGIGLESYFANSMITDNIIHNMTVSSTFPNSCVGIEIAANGDSQNAMTNVVIARNLIYNIPGSGIVQGDSTQYLTIAENILTNCGTSNIYALGITTSVQLATYPTKTIISNNQIINQQGIQGYGIAVQGLGTGFGYFQIEGNKIDNAQGGGILVGQSTNCMVRGNQIINVGQGSGVLNGIDINGKWTLLSDNMVVGAVGTGLNILSGANTTIVGLNFLQGNGTNYSDVGSGTELVIAIKP